MYSMRKLRCDKSYEFIKTLKKIDESITDYLLTIIEHSAIIASGTLAYYDANGFIVRGDEETSIALTNDRMSNYSIYIIADETGIEALEEIDAFEPEDESIETTTDTTNGEKKLVERKLKFGSDNNLREDILERIEIFPNYNLIVQTKETGEIIGMGIITSRYPLSFLLVDVNSKPRVSYKVRYSDLRECNVYITTTARSIETLERIGALEPEDVYCEPVTNTTDTPDTTNEEKKEVVDVAHDNDGIVGLIKRQVTYTFDLTKVELGLPYRITFLEDTVIFDVAYRKGSNIYALLLRAFPGRLIFVQTRMMGSGDDYDDLRMEKILMIFELTPNMKFKLERCEAVNQNEE